MEEKNPCSELGNSFGGQSVWNVGDKKKSGLFEHGTFRQVAMEICSRTQQYVEEDYPRCVEKNGWRINL